MSVAKYRSGEDVYYLSNGKIVKSTIVSSTIYPGDEQAVYEVADSQDGAVRKEIYEDELFLTDISAAANYKKNLLERIIRWDAVKETVLKEIEVLEIRYKV